MQADNMQADNKEADNMRSHRVVVAKKYLSEYAGMEAERDNLDAEALELLTQLATTQDSREYRDCQAMLDAIAARIEVLNRGLAERRNLIASVGFGARMDILTALYIDGASVRTVAEMTGRTERRVRQMRDRALVRLSVPRDG